MLSHKRRAAALAALFWLAVWHIASVLVGNDILLVSPLAALTRLFEMALTPWFWSSAAFSLLRIMGGFFSALAAGTLLAVAAARFPLVKALLAPLTGAAKAVPVASYTILLLVFLRARSLSFIIAFLMILPIVYDTLSEGLRNTDRKLLEMAKVFRVPPLRRLRSIYIPQILPYLISAVGVGVGIAWKSGVAAEVIGLPQGSVGSRLYEAKLFLDMRGLFAWTVAVMLLCAGLEKLTLWLIKRAARALERM
ncbi:MAG: ABC transporter permease subunit [Oscillospiraceae bacterium]|nr:ABC transporter permease subunit [Oscillospiraceae bacterium]